MRKIFVVGGGLDYANWMQGKLVSNLKDADLIVFTGGEDVTPKLYGEPKGSRTYNNWHRDVYEKEVFEQALAEGKHMIGICRGSQLLCVLSGGRLVQHQDNPHYVHPIYINDKNGDTVDKILITSTHHQAQYPYNMPMDDYKVIGYTNNISKVHLDGNDKEIAEDFEEVEIAYYPKTKCLAIQGHPEMIWNDRLQYKKTFEYLHGLLERHLNNSI